MVEVLGRGGRQTLPSPLEGTLEDPGRWLETVRRISPPALGPMPLSVETTLALGLSVGTGGRGWSNADTFPKKLSPRLTPSDGSRGLRVCEGGIGGTFGISTILGDVSDADNLSGLNVSALGEVKSGICWNSRFWGRASEKQVTAQFSEINSTLGSRN